jgi:hypothetical protein
MISFQVSGPTYFFLTANYLCFRPNFDFYFYEY